MNYLVDTEEGIAAAEVEAEVPTGIVATRSAHIVLTVLVGMMTGIAIMKVGAVGTGAQVLDIGEDEVEAVIEDGIVALALLEKAVRSGELELSNGIEKRKNKKRLIKPLPLVVGTSMKTLTMASRMVTNITVISTSSQCSKKAMDTDLLINIWSVLVLLMFSHITWSPLG